jgi:hypothetical protein
VPVPYVTLPSSTVYLPLSTADPLSAAALLANAGATLTDVYGNAIDGTLAADTSAVNGSVAGTYTATITGTDDYGFASSPVPVTVVIYLSAQMPGSVSITGTPAVGGTLTASPSGWAALSDPEFQWLRDGIEIPGATGATYTVTGADAGQTLSVRMTESPEWYSTASAISDPVTVPAPDQGGTPAPVGPQSAPISTPFTLPPAAPHAPVAATPKISSASYRSGSVRLKVKVSLKGKLTIKVATRSGKRTITLGTHEASVTKAETVSTSVKLSESAKARIKRASVTATVTITFDPSAKGAKTVSSHKTMIIKKGTA